MAMDRMKTVMLAGFVLLLAFGLVSLGWSGWDQEEIDQLNKDLQWGENTFNNPPLPTTVPDLDVHLMVDLNWSHLAKDHTNGKERVATAATGWGIYKKRMCANTRAYYSPMLGRVLLLCDVGGGRWFGTIWYATEHGTDGLPHIIPEGVHNCTALTDYWGYWQLVISKGGYIGFWVEPTPQNFLTSVTETLTSLGFYW